MKKILIICLTLVLLTGCTTGAKDTYTKYESRSSEVGFDTLVTFLAYTKTEKEFDTYFETVKQEFIHYNSLFDRYNDYEGINNIKTINDQAGIAPVKVDPEIIEMIEIAKEYSELSNGYFDITLGAVLDIWHEYREEGIVLNSEDEYGRVPTMDMLKEAEQYTGWQFVEIDKEASTVYLNHTRAKLDVGAIAKGYATEKVALRLEKDGVEYAVVSGGGNVRTINTKADGTPWAIGVEKPSLIVKGESLDIFSIPTSTSIVTSGDYQRYYIGPDDVRYSHLIDPHTLMPATNFQSVTIITPDSGAADALSTAVYMMSYDEAQEFIKKFNDAHPDQKIDAVWVLEGDEPNDWQHVDGFSLTMTETLKQYSKLNKQ